MMTPGKLDELEAAIAGCEIRTMSARELMQEVLPRLATAVGCTWATYWQVSLQPCALLPEVTWKRDPQLGSDLERHTLGRRLSMSEGTAGHVWRSRKPIWTRDLVNDMCLPRSLEAKANGMQGGIWFAVKSDTVVYGVVEMLGPDVIPSNDSLLLTIERLGMVLGAWVARGATS